MFGSGPNPLAAAIKKQRQDSDEVNLNGNLRQPMMIFTRGLRVSEIF